LVFYALDALTIEILSFRPGSFLVFSCICPHFNMWYSRGILYSRWRVLPL